jgi:hypothetical protein
MWLLVIWGRRERESRLGYAADYCRVCHEIEPFEIVECRMSTHFWFIPLERGRLRGHKKICPRCHIKTETHPARFAGFDRSARHPLESLIQKTYPTVRERFQEELAMDEKIAAGGQEIDQSTRERLVMEVFSLAEPHFRSGSGHDGRRVLVLGLRPLKPNDEEIRACLQRYRNTGCRMGRILSDQDAIVLIYPEKEVKDPSKFSY